MRIYLFIPFVFIIFSCISFAQTNSKDVDPFLGSYELGGRANLVWFNSNLNSSGFQIGHALFSGDTPQQPSLPDFQENDSVISTDGVSGNFLMSSVSQQGRDEAVLSTMESVGDSLIRIRLYVDQYVNGAWSVVPETIDFLKAKASTVGERMLIRMTSGYFTGGPAKEFAVAYNLPGSSNLITIRVFKLDGTTGRPIQITWIKDDTLSPSLGQQAFFDITAGNFEGNGLDQLLLVKNNAVVSAGATHNISLGFHAYDFDRTTKNIVSKGIYYNKILTVADPNWGQFPKHPLVQLVLTSGDYTGSGRDECVLGFGIYYWWGPQYSNPRARYYVEPFSLSSSLTKFTFTSFAYSGSLLQAQHVIEQLSVSNADPSNISGLSMSLASGDLNRNGTDELVVSCLSYTYVLTLDSSLTMTMVDQNEKPFSKLLYMSHRRAAVADIDADTTFSNISSSNWDPEVITWGFSANPYNGTTEGASNTLETTVYKLSDSAKVKLAQVGNITVSNSKLSTTSMGDGGILLGDFQGNAIRLGRPYRKAVTNLIEPAIIINAPPVAFDVIGDSTYNICDAYPITNSSSDAFSSVLNVTHTSETAVSTQTHSSWGVSSTLSVGGGFLGLGVQLSLTAKYGQDFDHTQEYDSTFSVTQNITAEYDDYIDATETDYDIWEYPVYADGAMKGHVLAVIAHPEASQLFSSNQSAYGNNIILNHEPGNLLSYPDDPKDNPDMSGSPIYEGGISISQTPSPKLTLDWNTIASTSTKMSSNYGLSTKVSLEDWGASLETEGNYDHTATSTQTTTFTNNIEMDVKMGTVNSITENYTVTPYIYWSVNGPLVLDYAVKFLPTGGGLTSFWEANYSKKPDLAWNCFYRYMTQMGFSGPIQLKNWTKEIQIYPSTPKEGDTVTVMAEIHNYSLDSTAKVIPDVRFFLGSSDRGGIPVLDLKGDSVFKTPDPVAARGDQIIKFKWKVPSGLVSSDSIMYAVIDPDNKIPELKENNNVGWNHISIMNVTAVSPTKSNQISNYALSQNYPNPFNPVTRINYQIPKFSHVTIKVYNILGQEIATLVNKEKMAGHYSVDFNASRFASGIYFYRMRAGDFVSTKKLILLK